MTRTRLVVYLSLFMALAGFGITIPILPFMARDLGASPVGVSLLVSVFALCQFVSAPVWGSMSDRFGRKALLAAGLFGYSLSFFAAGLSSSVAALIASRALGGLLSGSIFPCSQALIADVTPKAERGPAMAAMGAWINLGFLFGPAIGGALSPLGFRLPMFIAGAVVVFTSLLAAAGLREPAGGDGRAAPAGSRTAGPGRSGPTGRSGWPRPEEIALALRSPIAPYLLLVFAICFSTSGMTALLAYFIIDRLGGTSVDAGTIFTALGLMGLVTQGLLVGRMIQRYGERRVALWGAAVTAVGFVALVPATSLAPAVAAIMVVGLGSSLMRPAQTSAVSCLTPLPQGLTLGVQASLDSLGRMVGPVYAGWVYGFGMTLPFWSAALVMALSGTAAAAWTARLPAGSEKETRAGAGTQTPAAEAEDGGPPHPVTGRAPEV